MIYNLFLCPFLLICLIKLEKKSWSLHCIWHHLHLKMFLLNLRYTSFSGTNVKFILKCRGVEVGRKGRGGRQALAVDLKRGKQLGKWETKLGEWGVKLSKTDKNNKAKINKQTKFNWLQNVCFLTTNSTLSKFLTKKWGSGLFPPTTHNIFLFGGIYPLSLESFPEMCSKKVVNR